MPFGLPAILAMGAGGGGAAATGGSSALLQALLSGGAGFLSGLGGGDDSAKDSAKISQETTRETLLLGLLMDEIKRQQQNRALETTVPIRQELMRTILDPTRVAGGRGLLGASSTPRTYRAEGGGVSLQAPTMKDPEAGAPPDIFGRPAGPTTQYGPQASPEELASLVPDFSRFAAMQQNAQQMTAGITPQAFQRGSTLQAVANNPALGHVIAPGRGSAAAQAGWQQTSQAAINNLVNPPRPFAGFQFPPKVGT